jgi:DNA-binding NarL/FixJ family response regulator
VSRGADSALRVVVAEDSFLLRAGVVRVLEANGFAVVGEASDADELLEQAREQRPDVVVTDIRMPPTNTDEGLRAAAVIRPSCRGRECSSCPSTSSRATRSGC